ncbi:hypothetical protein MKK65_26045 [Methylobacterium sp. J-001]|uniref:hypothetical protein n=1 Tax=Methylobacterium sp. J-001 TaxID=2836609 RepID=UPI001FB8A93A|nr:hypothetical protein [Methylobacterium sp. J-001]MCJ2119993.1 hypothetical protein [Methylobacterium sp. J-001]
MPLFLGDISVEAGEGLGRTAHVGSDEVEGFDRQAYPGTGSSRPGTSRRATLRRAAVQAIDAPRSGEIIMKALAAHQSN